MAEPDWGHPPAKDFHVLPEAIVDNISETQTAVVSSDGAYRYILTRGSPPYVNFVMLNPSTAGATVNDPTVRRCISFARSWGMGLIVTNLFALRSTDPKAIELACDPIGVENNLWLRKCAAESNLVVAAWGTRGSYAGRDVYVVRMLRQIKELYVLGTTKEGHPKHPLYLHANSTMKPWYEAGRL